MSQRQPWADILPATRERKLLAALSSSAQGSAGGLLHQVDTNKHLPFLRLGQDTTHAEEGNQVPMIYENM